MKYKLYAIFFLVIALGVAAIFFISFGYYPIAIVNGRFITAKTFVNDYAVASVYYQNILKTYEKSSSTPEILTPAQIQQSVLTGLIENVLIDDGARKEIGSGLDNLVNEKVNQAVDSGASGDIEKAVKSVYGINMNDFKNEILVPQAERDLLTGSLFLKGQKIEDWLTAAKKAGNIIILSGKFYWDGENVNSR
ncbi:MAG TPA: hypothetical protein VMV71_03185 [Candidatus Paceibacterota bacterium]|nr:hypothetical protein [Candidatus Paceibacterota bacterium]